MKNYLPVILMIALVAGCSDVNSPGVETKFFDFDFESTESWEVGFADYPVGEEEFYELTFENTVLPPYLGTNIPSLMISGNNHSDDLFMYATKYIDGLDPNSTYNVRFEMEIATNASSECLGVGGAPGTSVYLKAGVSVGKPGRIVDEYGHYLMDIDKGNQSQGGENAINLGHFGNSNPCENTDYLLKELDNQDAPFSFTTDGAGSGWIIIGTDSGFEATTRILYNSLTVRFDK